MNRLKGDGVKLGSHCVHHAGRDVPVLVERKRVKNFNLHVRADASVFCSVPNAASSKQIDDFLTRHASWIAQHVERAEQSARTQPRHDEPTCDGLTPLQSEIGHR